MSLPHKIVEEIAGRDPYAMDFIFADQWEPDLFLSYGQSRKEQANSLPATKILFFEHPDNHKPYKNKSLLEPDIGHISPGGMVLSKVAVKTSEAF